MEDNYDFSALNKKRKRTAE